jgi:acetylglutamate/LysW-gamma-L-alpha-aminoadipate kinase
MNVLKIGGGANIDPTPALQNVAARVRAGESWIVVHGCSARANQLMEAGGLAVHTLTSPGGHTSRYTNAAAMAVFATAAAQINAEMTQILTEQAIPAVGLVNTGVIRGQRKATIRAIQNGRQVVIRDDYSGKITAIQTAALRELVAQGITPVIAPLARGAADEALNVDGDLAAAEIARVVRAEKLIILSNVRGLLADVFDPDSLIPTFALGEISRYQTLAAGRMKKKLLAAEKAQAQRTIIAAAQGSVPIDAALSGQGTHITAGVDHAFSPYA